MYPIITEMAGSANSELTETCQLLSAYSLISLLESIVITGGSLPQRIEISIDLRAARGGRKGFDRTSFIVCGMPIYCFHTLNKVFDYSQ